MFPPKPLDIVPPEGGCSEGLDAFRFFLNRRRRGNREGSNTRFSLSSMEMSRLTRDGTTADPSREAKFSRANKDREIFIFPIQLTTCKIGNFTRLILLFLNVMTIHTTYIHPPLGGSMRVVYNDSDDRAGLRGYVQFNKYKYIRTHTHTHTLGGSMRVA